MAKVQLHIVQRGSGWAVVGADSLRATKVLQTKREAVAHAKQAIGKEGGYMVIHSRDGTIQSTASGDERRPVPSETRARVSRKTAAKR